MLGKKSKSKDGQEQIYGQRQLDPLNMTSLKDQMEVQLENLKEVNAMGAPLPPFVHKPGSGYSRSVLSGK